MPDNPNPGVDHWAMLKNELDQWLESGQTASFWWRDDDAVEETTQLRRLDALSRETEVPVSIAVIPTGLSTSLPRYLSQRENFIALQHGYSHRSYATPEKKKIELGGERSSDEIQVEITEGRLQLSKTFGEQFLPVMVPPWNRIESRIFPLLADVGFSGVSTMWARESAHPYKGLLQVNTHLDPVNWRHGRGFIGETGAIEQILNHLSTRRIERNNLAEPTGILTHHLCQNDEVWVFCRSLIETLNRHPAVKWLNAREIWVDEG